jgi:cysteine desulfurase/selenocysteine lyase
MSTSEYKSVDAESDLPLGAAEIAALASQLYAASIRPGPDSPPQPVPVAPRGSVPDTTAATSAGQTAAGSADLYSAPVPLLGISDVYVPAPTSPGPEPPPQTVPVAPRGNMPDTTAAPSGAQAVGSVADPYLPLADFSAFEVPSAGIVPTVPGVLAGASNVAAPPSAPVAPRGSAPYSGIGWLPDAPSVIDLNWSDGVPAAPAALNAPATGDEYSYHFLTSPVTGSDPVPQLTDDHEVFDVNAIREDFPILEETVNRKPLIWFDNAATTQKPQSVIDRISYFYAHENSNIHRAANELAARATDAYEEARETVRRFIGAEKAVQNIFVRGTTEAINLVAYAWGGKHLGPGDEIVITHLEHHASSVPWQLLSQKTGAVLRDAPVDEAGNLLLGEFEDLVRRRSWWRPLRCRTRWER